MKTPLAAAALVVALWSVLIQLQPQKEDFLLSSEEATFPNLFVVELGKSVSSSGDLFCMLDPGSSYGILMQEDVFLGLNWPYRKGLTAGVYTCMYHQDIYEIRPWNRRDRVFL